MESIKEELADLDIAKICPLQIDDGGVIKDVNEYKGLYNVSKGRLASVVSNGYVLVQHEEYFSAFLSSLDKFKLKYDVEVGNCGNKAVLDIEFKDKNIKFSKLNEEFTTGIRLVNSYDKTTGIGIMPRYKRLACMNGMVLASLGTVMVCRHNSELAKNIDVFIKTRLDAVINQSKNLQDLVSRSMVDSIEWKIATKIICELFKLHTHREEVLGRLDIAMIEKKPNGTYDVFRGDPKQYNFVNDCKDAKGKKKSKFTRWEIYNAITNYLSTDTTLSKQLEMWMQRKAEKVFTTELKRMPIAEIEI